MQVLNPYLEKYPDSGIGINLKACNTFRLSDGRQAEAELKPLLDIMAASPSNFENDLIRHNLVVFRDGENALQVFPPLVEVVPEARLNLIIHYLRSEELHMAYGLVKDLEPSTPQEYILKAVALAMLGQSTDNRELIRQAQQTFRSCHSCPLIAICVSLSSASHHNKTCTACLRVERHAWQTVDTKGPRTLIDFPHP
jgi:intraflagellar transport protein 56